MNNFGEKITNAFFSSVYNSFISRVIVIQKDYEICLYTSWCLNLKVLLNAPIYKRSCYEGGGQRLLRVSRSNKKLKFFEFVYEKKLRNTESDDKNSMTVQLATSIKIYFTVEVSYTRTKESLIGRNKT